MRALVLLAACAAPAAPPTSLANTAPPDLPHAAQGGLRGFEDGQPITKATLAGWVAGTDVIEYVPNYFVFVRHGVRLSNEVLDSVVPEGAIGVIDNRSPTSPSLIAESAAIINPWGVQVGMTIAEVRQRVPGLVCTGAATPLCQQPPARIHFVTDAGKVHWWVWHGSGHRPRRAAGPPGGQ